MFDIRKYISGIKLRPDLSGSHVGRDWLILMGTFLLLLFALITFSVRLFMQVEQGEIFTLESPSKQETNEIDLERLQGTLLYFEEKRTTFQELQKQAPDVPNVL